MNKKACLMALAVLLSGCSAPPLGALQAKLNELLELVTGRGSAPQPQAGLSEALRLYEEGRYAEAEQAFKTALERRLPPADAVTAHKHLAFIHCAAERPQQCRSEFQLALQADPGTDLDPAEAGHPTWGPVFRSLTR
ncbi:MAG: TssQ family T6SS-associated lipoprotein [Burkholderiales bacterium]